MAKYELKGRRALKELQDLYEEVVSEAGGEFDFKVLSGDEAKKKATEWNKAGYKASFQNLGMLDKELFTVHDKKGKSLATWEYDPKKKVWNKK